MTLSKGFRRQEEFFMKVRAMVLTLITGSLLAAPAYAQLGGVVGSATQAGGSLGNTGLGVDQTLNGTFDAGRDGLNGDLNSATQAKAKTPDLDKTAKKAKKSAEESKSKSLDVMANGHAKTESTVDRTKDVQTPVNAGSSVNASGEAKHSSGDSSLQVKPGSNTNVNAAGVGVNASADANTSAEAKSEPGSKDANSNANSGDGKLLGLDRAESRVDNATALQALDRNEKKQAEKKASRPQPKTEAEGHAQSQAQAGGKVHGPNKK
jgi:hypothetical protein